MAQQRNRQDGTLVLLRAAALLLAAGGICLALAVLVFGGIGRHGPHTDGGWMAVMAALLCLPLGCMLLVLGGAKWLRNRRSGWQFDKH